MYALVSKHKTRLPAGEVIRMPGTWDDFRTLRDGRGDQSQPRIRFRSGEILLMNPMPRHGREAHLLARTIELLLDTQARNYEAFTPITNDGVRLALDRSIN
jgi:Uma2 family endonuclease